MPIFILWFGIDDLSKILLVAFTCVFPILVSTYHGATAVAAHRDLVGGGDGHVRARAAAPVIFPADAALHFQRVRVTVPVALITAFTAEMVAGGGGSAPH